jgi:DNA-binding transcriptional LysR family regulator
MDLYQIKHFVAVVEGGGFTKGAERVAVSQPAISASIAKLEAELNVKLLERRHSQVVPTPAGTRLLEMGRTILQTCNAAKSEVKAIAHRRPLRIAVISPLSSGPVSNLLNSFQQANPNVPVEVLDGHCDGWCNCDQLFGPLDEGDRDAVLSILNDRLASKFATQALFKIPYMLAVPADHRFAKCQAVSAGDLASERLILPDDAIA